MSAASPGSFESATAAAYSHRAYAFDRAGFLTYLRCRGISDQAARRDTKILARLCRELGDDILNEVRSDLPGLQVRAREWACKHASYLSGDAARPLAEFVQWHEDAMLAAAPVAFSFADLSDDRAMRLGAELAGGTSAPSSHDADVLLLSLPNALQVDLNVSTIESSPALAPLLGAISEATRAFVVRIEWDAAKALRLARTAFTSLLAGTGFHVQAVKCNTARFVPMDGAELFLVGFRMPQAGPLRPCHTRPPLRILDVVNPELDPSGGLLLTGREISLLVVAKYRGVNVRVLPKAPRAARITERYAATPAAAVVTHNRAVRRVSPREAARLIGLTDDTPVPDEPREAYRVLASLPPVPAVEAVLRRVAFLAS